MKILIKKKVSFVSFSQAKPSRSSRSSRAGNEERTARSSAVEVDCTVFRTHRVKPSRFQCRVHQPL